MAAPLSTYRLQIRPTFTLHDAAQTVPYLAALGVDAVYVSPILRATEGSDHGYDVVDPTRIDEDRGGEEGWAALREACAEHGLGIIVDVVPNHMGVGHARENRPWWETLRLGREAETARWFDIDWEQGLRLPALGDDPATSDFRVDADTEVLHYGETELPLAPGSVHAELQETLAAQNYELVCWREENVSLTYRRFFAVTSLAGLRIEDDDVYEATHARIRGFLDEGVSGLRIDHPDGLRDPGTYLRRLRAELGDDRYLVIEKIAAPGEHVPDSWPVDGTVGYEALRELNQLLVDPAATDAITALYADITGDRSDAHAHELRAKREQIADLFGSELARLARFAPDVPRARQALAELAAHFDVYRTYLEEGAAADHLDAALTRAAEAAPDVADALAALAPRLHDPADELCLRFQQLTGPVAAKGVEDMACYRYNRLVAANEVGGDLATLGATVEHFHASNTERLAREPRAMLALSTHDTKRGEDVRARLAVLAELPEQWEPFARTFVEQSGIADKPFAYLLAQTLVGVGPIERDRLHAYAEKAMREQGTATAWLNVAGPFEAAVHAAIERAYDDPALRGPWDACVAAVESAGRSNALTQKLLQLTMPGVPDVYQGTEVWEDSLVDPDNRRPVDFAALAGALPDAVPGAWEDPAYKQWLVRVALNAKRGRDLSAYTPVGATGAQAAHAVAFERGGLVSVGTLRPLGLAAAGGWGDTVLELDGGFRDLLSGRDVDSAQLADILRDGPVALLERR